MENEYWPKCSAAQRLGNKDTILEEKTFQNHLGDIRFRNPDSDT